MMMATWIGTMKKMSNIEKIEDMLSSIEDWTIKYNHALSFIPYKLFAINKLLLEELKDQKDMMARLDKSMSYIIKETINHGEHGWVPMEGE